MGMVLTSNDPATLLAFNDTMKDFAKQLIMNPLKEEGN